MNNRGNNTHTFIARLNEFKEFIAILVFFTGGLIWIYGFFATKEQLEDLKCSQEQNFTLLDRGSKQDKNKDLLAKNNLRIDELKANGDPTDSIKEKIKKLEAENMVLQCEIAENVSKIYSAQEKKLKRCK